MPARPSRRRKLLSSIRKRATQFIKRLFFKRMFRASWRQLQIETLCERKLMAVNIAAVRPDTGHPNDLLSFYLDTESLSGPRNASHEISFHYGFSSSSIGSSGVDDRVLAGDLSGVGFDQAIVTRDFAGALQWLGDTDRDTDQEYFFRFGLAGFRSLVADMNGDGVDDAVAVDTSTLSGLNEWYIHYGVPGANPFPTNDSTVGINATFSFGLNGDIPLVGDMNGDGRADVLSVRNDGSLYDWFISHAAAGATPYPNNTATVLGISNTINNYGSNSTVPTVGDWDNDGDDNIGVIDEGTSPSTWYLDTNGGGAFEFSLQYGLAGDQYIVGKWADVVWNGNAGSNWENVANWSNTALPSPSQKVVIDQPGISSNVTINSATASIMSLHTRESITISGGSMTLATASQSAASVTVSGGILRLDAPISTSQFTMSSGVTQLIANDAVVASNLLITGGQLRSLGASSLSNNIALGGTVTVVPSGVFTLSGAISGNGGILLSSPGEVRLTGSSTMTGTVTVASGTYRHSGNVTHGVSVGANGTLRGTGLISGNVTIQNGGHIAPGNSPGILNTGNFNLNAGAFLDIELGGSASNVGIDYDQVNVTGTVTLAGNLNAIRFSDFSAGQSYTIINNDGVDPVVGTFDGLGEGATVQIGNNGLFTISYVGGTGNDVVLTSISGMRQVSSTADSGAGSLRQAITDANSNVGPDVITFGFIGAGPHVIVPTTALPTITSSTLIDGTSLTAYSGTPIIELNGASLGTSGTGLSISGIGINVEIAGLSITDFGTHGISSGFASLIVRDSYIGLKPDGATAAGNGLTDPFASVRAGVFQNAGEILLEDNVISGNDDGVFLSAGPTATLRRNRIGTNAAGTAAVGNFHGIYLDTTNGVVIGGNSGSDGNLISGNTVGIAASVFASNNVIVGNTIGLNLAGSAALPNATGISIEGSFNRVGTNGDGTNDVFERNLISGNTNVGVHVTGSNAFDNIIAGNFIGTDSTGLLPIGGSVGINIDNDASNTLIGGFTTTPGSGPGNVIAGTTSRAIMIATTAGDNTTMHGNIIGLAADGVTDITTSGDGVRVQGGLNALIGGDDALDGSSDGIVQARNIISGFGGANQAGIAFSASGSNLNTTIYGNYIGTDITGTLARGNYIGIAVGNAPGTKVGGTTAGAGNVISANAQQAVYVFANGASTVQGNIIGLDALGDTELGNAFGVQLSTANNVVGGSDPAARNIISGNDEGIRISSVAAIGNTVQGNYIGTDITGLLDRGNGVGIQIVSAVATTIGGAIANSGNVISGNEIGILVESFTADPTSTLIAGNYIGVDVTGAGSLGNEFDGIDIRTGGNTIGGTDALSRNIISGNGQRGLSINGVNAVGNIVSGNYVGTDTTGLAAIANLEGIRVSATGNTIGGSLPGAGNLISGNDGVGIWILGASNSVVGNLIGTDITGTAALGNLQQGIRLQGNFNTIGGPTPSDRNVISGNLASGISVPAAASNLIEGNYIGPSLSGATSLGNQGSGVEIRDGSNETTVRGNVISGNQFHGIQMGHAGSEDNLVVGNIIGLDATGSFALGNVQSGVYISEGIGNEVGDGTLLGRNIISGNLGNGVGIAGTLADNNSVRGNFIGTDLTGSIAIPNVYGIRVDVAKNTTIGGTVAGSGNLISGNSTGIWVNSVSTGDTNIQGNLIGTTADGLSALGNSANGIWITNSNNTIVGGATTSARNIISGTTNIGSWFNDGNGISVDGNSNGTIIRGNFIGTDITGNASLPNADSGIGGSGMSGTLTIGGSSSGEGNLISGNIRSGILLHESVTVTIQGNRIGTNAAGDAALTNGESAISQSAGSGWTIGGMSDWSSGQLTGAGNLIVQSGGGFSGVQAGNNLTFQGNFVGTDITGTLPLGVNNNVIRLSGPGNVVGGATIELRNILSGNGGGIWLNDSDGAIVEGNYIGTDRTGNINVGNRASGINVDGTENSIIRGNVVSGTSGVGILLSGSGSTGNTLVANFIGTNATGSGAIPNAIGISIQSGAANNIIGGTSVSSRNLISGNQGPGLWSEEASSLVQGNYFGVDVSGVNVLPNYSSGNNAIDIVGGGTIGGLTTTPGSNAGNLFGGTVQLTQTSSVLGNTFGLQADGETILGVAVPATLASSGIRSEAAGSTIGGTAVGSRNVFAGYGSANFNGNSYLDILGGGTNTVQGNYFGTDVTGLLNRNTGDVRGIQTAFGASGNIVGGSSPGARNVIVGGTRGFETYEPDNVFEGNYVGIAADGVTAYGMSQVGVFIRDNNNTIRGNVISGSSTVAGLRLEDTTTGTIVVGNYIGTDASGTLARPNLIGISVGTSGNTIGGPNAVDRNIISGNADYGLRFDFGAINNTVEGNYVGVQIDGTTSLLNTNGAVNITGNAALKGTGTFSGNIVNQGSIAPGNSPGIITINGDYIQTISGTLEIEIEGTNPAMPDFDQLIVNGAVSLNGALTVTHLNGFSPIDGNSFTIIDNDGTDAVVGTFAGLSEGATFVSDGKAYSISYVGGTGNDVVLTFVSAFVVTSTADSGPGSLREAVQNANDRPGADTITFAPALTAGGSVSIVLGSQMVVTDTSGQTTITGPGSALIAISGNDATRMFQIDAGADLSLSGLALIDGQMAGSGGAILNFGSLTLDRTTFNGNRSFDDSGAIANAGGTLTISESTFTGNITSNDGGAIRSNGAVTILNSTFSGNSAGIAGGAIRNDGTLTITNTIVAGNTAPNGSDIFGTIISGGYNLIQSTSNLTVTGTTTGNILGQAALLASLADNGGNALTMALAGNSPAVGAGDPNADGTTSQNGILRSTPGIDIGAYQSDANPLIVTHTGDSGLGSLRYAIEWANINPGLDTIVFNIAGSGVHTISPLNALPAITDSVYIDATTESDYAGFPLIELRGDSAGAGVSGFVITASNSTIRGFVINRFTGSGIVLTGTGAANNTIAGNFIGTNTAGNAALPNSNYGILLSGGSSSNTIGGVTSIAANVISGNSDRGLVISGSGSDNNIVIGNLIGTNASGTGAVPNGTDGIWLINGPKFNRIGTDGDGVNDAAERNIISGNARNGVQFEGVGTNSNVVAGNYIGTTITGITLLGNGLHGVIIFGTASNNRIGTDGSNDAFNASERNIISGSGQFGVRIRDIGTNGSIIAGNYIGTDVTGTLDFGNGLDGIILTSGTAFNRIGTNGDGVNDDVERNLISGNNRNGIRLDGSGTSNNIIAGNYIGTNAAGTAAVANSVNGILVTNGPANTRIGTGGTSINPTGERNVISGNTANGVQVDGGASTGTRIAGNYIGTNAAGTSAIANNNHGIVVLGGASNTIVGTNGDGNGDANEGNLISGNTYDGVSTWTGAAPQLVVAGNRIGTNAAGNSAIANGRYGVWLTQGVSNARIGTNGDGISDTLERNIISGNGFSGVFISDNSTNNRVSGNYIGTNATGDVALGNNFNGVIVTSGAHNNLIGTNGDGSNDHLEGNVIASSGHSGIWLDGVNNTVIAGNYVGTNALGSVAFPNVHRGIGVAFNAVGTRIGTDGDGQSDSFERNVVSGNFGQNITVHGSGVIDTVIAGNYIGLDATGTYAINQLDNRGIFVEAGAKNTRIGTDGSNDPYNASERNVISGNWWEGVFVSDEGTANTVIAGNHIGTNAAGDAAVPNGIVSNWGLGIAVLKGATDTRIGTNEDGVYDELERNVISGNKGWGIHLSNLRWGVASTTPTERTKIAGNYIGLNAAGTAALSNGFVGVLINEGASNNTVGGSTVAARNVISGNTQSGITIQGAETDNNVVAGNYIGTDVTGMASVPNANVGMYIEFGAKNTRVGTNGDGIGDAEERNIIAGHPDGGIFIQVAATGTVVAGNYVGLNAIGTAALPLVQTTGAGITVHLGATNTRIGTDGSNDPFNINERNVIGGGAWHGVVVSGVGTTNALIAGNYIGTDATGNSAIGNGQGVSVWYGASGVRIGTDSNGVADEAERNVISGNNGYAVDVNGINWDGAVPTVRTNNITVAGNYIGTNASGSAAVRNLSHGVFVHQGAFNVQVGSGLPGAGNVISGNNQVGVYVSDSTTSGVSIQGNQIGTDAAGTSSIQNIGQGIRITAGANNNIIGTDSDGLNDVTERNIISGNRSFAVYIDGTGSNLNQVAGNYIGLDVSGSFAVPNGISGTTNTGLGIMIINNALFNRVGTNGDGIRDEIERNVISGNYGDGVKIQNGSSQNIVAGNYIGTDYSGSFAIPNARFGVFIQNANNNRIGTDSNGIADIFEGNVISGNLSHGLQLSTSAGGNQFAGNFIGTDATGTIALGNQGFGVTISSDSVNNQIGVNSSVGGNVIGGNAQGGILSNSLLPNSIINNRIGTDVTGTLQLGNGIATTTAGITVTNGLLTIGGLGINEANIIANNTRGILVTGTGRATIRGNSIYSNDGLGIDLNDDGVTPNDASDSDIGPSGLQNYPFLNNVTAGGNTRIVGQLASSANANFFVDFYASNILDPSGFGEGRRYLGTTSVTTNVSGIASFDVTINVPTLPGEFISAIATDSLGNSSEFSAAVDATSNLPPTVSSSDLILTEVLGEDGFGQPVQVFTEGRTVRLDGLFDNADTNSGHDVYIDWGDGTPIVQIFVPSAAPGFPDPRGFTGQHAYADDRLSGTSQDDYIITVIVSDRDDNAVGSASITVTIENEVPVLTSLELVPTSGFEGGTATLVGAFEDTGLDLHTLQIDWGDGSPLQSINLSGGVRSFSVPHTFLNNSQAVTLTLSDDDLGTVSQTIPIFIQNLTPTAAILGPSSGVEGSALTFTGVANDAGQLDVLTKSWLVTRNGEAILDAVGDQLIFTPGNDGTYRIELTVRDSDGASVVTSRTLNVANAAPSIPFASLQLAGLNGVVITQAIEGTTFTLSGTVLDPGTEDSHIVSIRWGDGSPDRLIHLTAGVTHWTATHTYSDDNPTGSPIDAYQVRVTVDDLNGGSSSTFTSINVANAAPEVRIVDDGSDPSTIRLRAEVTDLSLLDTFTYSWNIGAPIPVGTPLNQAAISFPRPTSASGTASVTVTDDDTGTATASAIFVAGTPLADAINVDPGSNANEVVISVQTGASSLSQTLPIADVVIVAAAGSNDTITINSALSLSASIDAGDGDDTIISSSGNDILIGGAGNDLIVAGEGNNLVDVSEGNDTASSGLGNDTYRIWGFSSKTITDLGGVDTLDFSGVASPSIDVVDGITLDLGLSSGEVQTVRTGGAVSLSGSFENVLGTAFKDRVTGTEGDNLLFGGFGDDTLSSGGGNDSIGGGEGNDLIFGGGFGDSTLDGGAGNDSIGGGQGNDLIFGGFGDDSISSGSGNESIDGGEGNDLIFGSFGLDTIDGGAGNDSIVGGSGNDLIFGGLGDDSIYSGSGDESIQGGEGNDLIFGGLDSSVDTIDGGSGNDSIIGGSGNDLIFGGFGDDSITAGAGNESISGGEGNDLIFGSFSGASTIDGGTGNDSIVGGSGNDLIFGGFGDDTIESGNGGSSIYGGSGNDLIFGSFGSGSDTIDGGFGNDSISGSGGNDLIFGGYGDDSIESSGGNTTIVGGEGNDLIFGASFGSSTIDGGSGNDSIVGSGGNDFIFGGFDNDTITAGTGNTTIDGGSGNDLIFGGLSGNSTIQAGSGDDSIIGGQGNDLIFGGFGNDTIDGGNGSSTLVGGEGNDLIFGGLGDSTIDGGSGNDSIIGAGGNDLIFGGLGDDTISAGGGAESIDGGAGNDLIFGGLYGSSTISGGSGNDSIIGGEGNDLIFGGFGNDTIQAGQGTESIVGGEGNDLIFGGYGSGGDTLDGGNGNDSIVGGSGNDLIYGGLGNDTITAGTGNDSIDGGEGNDLIFGGYLGTSTIDGGAGNDSIIGGEGNDLIFGGFGSDTIIAGSGNESINGGEGNDLIFGGYGGNDTIDGGNGDDSIGGGQGNDLIYGGFGNDTISAGTGSDTLIGGDGNDMIFGQADSDLSLTNTTVTVAGVSNAIESFERGMLVGGASANILDASGVNIPVKLIGGGGDDLLIGSQNSTFFEPGNGNDTLRGASANDHYRFTGFDSGNKTIEDLGGSDTLDLRGFFAPIVLDLAVASSQHVGGNLFITLVGQIENTYGTDFDDVIYGNSANNNLYGLGGSDLLEGRDGDDMLQAGLRRIVYLDFDSATEIGEHNYSQFERDAIQARIEQDYAPFDIEFTQTRPNVDQFVSIIFNAAVYLPGSRFVLGGISNRIGWRELSIDDFVQVDINGFFGTGVNQLPATSENYIALSSTIAAHELGHTYGLRHQDAFGPPGSGVFAGLDNAGRYRPVYTGPAAAEETRLHLMSSPASIGTTLIDALGNPFFGERESLKMAFAENGRTLSEAAVRLTQGAGTIALGELPYLAVPNTVIQGANAGQQLSAAAISVQGRIELTSAGRSESDRYTFTGRGGEVITIEVMSQVLRHRINNPIDSIVRVYDSSGQKVAYYSSNLGAFNDDQMEPTDSTLLDLILPGALGVEQTFTIEVDTFSVYQPEISSYLGGFNVAAFIANNPNHIAVTDTDTGEYELLIYRFDNTIAQIPTNDTLNGGAGADMLIGNSSKEFLIGYNPIEGDLLFDSSGGGVFSNEAPILEDIPAQIYNEGSIVSFSVNATDLENGKLTYSIEPVGGFNFPTGATVDPSTGVFNFSAVDEASYKIRVRVVDPSGLFDTQIVDIVINNVAPTVLAGNDVSFNEGESVILQATATDPGVNDELSYVWEIFDASNQLVHSGATSSITFNALDDGVYTAVVTVTDDSGATQQDTLTITALNIAPAVNAGDDVIVDEGALVVLLGNYEDAGVNDTHTYFWEIRNSANEVVASSTLLSTAFTPIDDGVYTATLTVTDNGNLSSFDVLMIQVNNAAPVVDAGMDWQIDEGSVASLSGSFTDAGLADTHTVLWEIKNQAGQTVSSSTDLNFSFIPTDDGIYVAYLSVTDDDGLAATDSILIHVANVAPISEAGENTSVDEGGTVVLQGAYVDVGLADTHTFLWEVRRSNGSLVATSNLLSYSFTPIDEGIYTATLTVTDDDGGATSDSLNIVVANVAPVVNAGLDRSGAEGSVFTLTGTASDAGVDDALSYSWVVTNQSNVIVAISNISSFDFIASDNGVYTATLTVNDSDGGITSDSLTITVSNVAPVITSFTASNTSGFGGVSINGLFADVAADTHTATINWGDGVTESIPVVQLLSGGSFTGQHVYASNGTYSITVTLQDDDGGIATATTTVTITLGIVELVNGQIRVIGTDQNDDIRIYDLLGVFVVYADFLPGLGIRLFASSSVSRVYIEGRAGNDFIDVSYFVTDRTEIYGGSGNDTIFGGYGNDEIYGGDGNDQIDARTGDDLIYGGSGNDTVFGGNGNDIFFGELGNDKLFGDAGNDILVGGDGNDELNGGLGGDLLIGGNGADQIFGNQGEDILIGGRTTFDGNTTALLQILAEWSSNRNYDTRIRNIRGIGTGTRLNGNNFLQKGVTVFDDLSTDLLAGDAGRDWFFVYQDDTVTGRNNNETSL